MLRTYQSHFYLKNSPNLINDEYRKDRFLRGEKRFIISQNR